MKIIKIVLPIFFLISLFSGCDTEKNKYETRPGNGGRIYGGEFKLSESEYIKSLFPPSIVDGFSYRVASQIYEGLFKFDTRTLKVVKSLAESYEIDSTGTIYTIKIKQGVFFHDNVCFEGGKGRELTAEDVKYSFTMLCTNMGTNQNFNLFKNIVKGATQYYNATVDGKKPTFEVEGIKVVDKFKIQLTLEKPNSIFIYNLAGPGTFIYPKEAFEKYGLDMRIKTVGTGPFYLANVDEDISIILKKNNQYHGVDSLNNKLPFLDAINIKFIKEKKNELFEFKKDNLDMLYRIPTDFIIDIVEEMQRDPKEREYARYELQRSPEMITHFLVFQTKDYVFQNKNVRKAFSYAIDREKILNLVLNNEGFAPGEHGITPPVFPDYSINDIKGYKYNTNENKDSASYYLKKAGFANGVGFPKVTLELNAEGGRNTFVAVEIQKELKDILNIDIELSVVPIAQSTEDAQTGKFQLLRLAWLADYPSPENFLAQFYGKTVPEDPTNKSYPNVSRYKNDGFDNLYEKAINSKSIPEANGYFKQAENLLMEDAPVLILWYDEGYRLVQSYVKNFPNNPMQYRDFSEVWIDKSKAK